MPNQEFNSTQVSFVDETNAKLMILEDHNSDDASMDIEKLTINRKYYPEESLINSFSDSFPELLTPKKKNVRMSQTNSPMSPPSKHSKTRFPTTPPVNHPRSRFPTTPPSKYARVKFRFPNTSPAPIDRAYRRRIVSISSSPCSSFISSPLTSPLSPPIKEIRSLKKKLHYHKSPKEGRYGRSYSKSDPTMLFPKKLNLSSNKYLYSDRHIPSRATSLLADGALLGVCEQKKKNVNSPGDTNDTYSVLLRDTILGKCGINHLPKGHFSRSNIAESTDQNSSLIGNSTSSPYTRIFRFKSPKKPPALDSLFSSPTGVNNQRMLCSRHKSHREISKSPFKVLDTPTLKDDFYLNLVDWSHDNMLAVGLESCVYLWNAFGSKFIKLCDLGEGDSVSSVSWDKQGTHLAIATHIGEVQIWDPSKCKRINIMKGHVDRVGTLAWNNHLLASGSRDRMIFLRDPRSSQDWEIKLLQGHKQEVCGLKWSFDDHQLASGGNDNTLFIWNARHSKLPILKCEDHTAAVRAIAWSPHQHGLLASGGGTYDRCIRFRNTLSNTPLNTINTGSQVCNLVWSKNVNEIVSTHGFSLRAKAHNNQIIVWKYPSMIRRATLIGHTYRVLYLAQSPDGQSIVTGSGDETLRFWNIFPSSKLGSQCFLSSYTIR